MITRWAMEATCSLGWFICQRGLEDNTTVRTERRPDSRHSSNQ